MFQKLVPVAPVPVPVSFTGPLSGNRNSNRIIQINQEQSMKILERDTLKILSHRVHLRSVNTIGGQKF